MEFPTHPQIKISIITATFNANAYLDNLLQSIREQKTKQVEFIIIDGMSKDDTIVKIKQNEDIIDYWISEPDKGIYDAWNKGIKISQGEWIMFLGADDILMPNALNKYLQLLKDKDFSAFDYISARTQYINKDGKLLMTIGEKANWNLMKNKMSAAHVGSIHNKKNLFNKVGMYNLDYKICGDYELLLRKKETLKSFFVDDAIAKMQYGGMSFTTHAINETYKIRKKHNTVPLIKNLLLLYKDYLTFITFNYRKKNVSDF
jgi:glycosyltransferase involved in cell wall biosynthesis